MLPSRARLKRLVVEKGTIVRVLIVEDEVIVAMTLEDMLGDLGCSVVGPATSLDEALLLVATADFDMALLDVNLDGRRSDEVADLLRQRGVPFAFITGYGNGAFEPSGGSPPVLSKPCTADSLAVLLRQVAR